LLCTVNRGHGGAVRVHLTGGELVVRAVHGVSPLAACIDAERSVAAAAGNPVLYSE
jgi:hypothetical protein